jgi:hypothetical protein
VPLQALNDVEIRELLLPFILQEHGGLSDIVCLEEFAIYGGANRADVAALNGLSHGYEIKSERDTLDRLPNQVDAYGAIFERATLVSAPRHLDCARDILPKWWGIVEVRCAYGSNCYLRRIRESRTNPAPRATAVASLLWRAEALDLLTKLGLDAGVRSKPSDVLIERLAERVKVEKLSAYVREILRARGDWRSAARLKQYDDSSLQPSSRLRYQRTPYGNIYR